MPAAGAVQAIQQPRNTLHFTLDYLATTMIVICIFALIPASVGLN